MMLIRFGRWQFAAGKWFTWKRYYFKGYKWTPFVKIRKRTRYPQQQTQ